MSFSYFFYYFSSFFPLYFFPELFLAPSVIFFCSSYLFYQNSSSIFFFSSIFLRILPCLASTFFKTLLFLLRILAFLVCTLFPYLAEVFLWGIFTQSGVWKEAGRQKKTMKWSLVYKHNQYFGGHHSSGRTANRKKEKIKTWPSTTTTTKINQLSVKRL